MHLAKMEAKLQPLKIGPTAILFSIKVICWATLCMSCPPFEFPKHFLRFHQIGSPHHLTVSCIKNNIFHTMYTNILFYLQNDICSPGSKEKVEWK